MRAVDARALSVLFALAVAGRASAGGAPAPPTSAVGPLTRPVLVELFTSQGCSSCPAADRLLTELGSADGGQIVPLAYHVDWWDALGWRDRFSSPAWTVRQKAYVASLRARAPYTPQAIVDGAAEVLGSDRARLLAAVAAAAARPAARLALEVAPADGEVTARVAIELPAELRGRRWELLLAVYETGLVTVVHRGENQGRELDNDYVVRTLRRAGRLRDRGEARIEREARLPLARDWQRSRLGVVAFLQDAETLAVGGVAARALGAP